MNPPTDRGNRVLECEPRLGGSRNQATLFGILLCVTAFFGWAIETHRFGLNDEKYYVFSWQHIPLLPLYFWAALSLIPFFAGQFLYAKYPRAIALALGLVMVSSLGLMIACAVVQNHDPNMNRIAWVIENSPDGGYFAYAVQFHDIKHLRALEILNDWPNMLPTLYGHVFNKPPGLVLFCIGIISLLGANIHSAAVTGIIIGILAAGGGVAATYLFIRYFTGNRDAAFSGASYFALCPGLIGFFPTFDQVYPLLTVGLAILWVVSLRRKSVALAVIFGILLAFTFFLNYLPAVLVFFLAGLTLLERRERKIGWEKIGVLCAAALAIAILIYLILFLVSGFNPIATFRAALATQKIRLQNYTAGTGFPARKLPGTIGWDLYGFAAGSGWMSYILAGTFLVSVFRMSTAIRWITLLCIGQFLFVALAGLIQSETERLWLFMLPMLMLPVGMRLSQMPLIARCAVYLALAGLAGITLQSMVFLV